MREKPRDKQRLLHIVSAINNILSFTEGIDQVAFKNNQMLQYAVVKNFEIIGEAAYHTTKELRAANPDIQWDLIIKFRHVLVHDYYNIDLDTVWRAIKGKVPDLKNDINTILSEKYGVPL